MPLTREQIIGKKVPSPVKKVDGTSLGPELYVRKVTAREASAWRKLCSKHEGDPPNGDAILATILASDEHGNRIFTDADADYLGDTAGHTDAIGKIITEGTEFNQMRAEDVEDVKKNSPMTESGSSQFNSPTG